MTRNGRNRILRDPAGAAGTDRDLIIIGGGIYGAMLCFEASLRGLRPLLLEKGDFGGETTFNWMRVLHGGLRYLQTLDLPRFYQSVGERRWFMETFPGLVRPQAFLMPLYGRGLKRPGVMKVALGVNDLLSCRRNRRMRGDLRLPRGRVLGPGEVRERFPRVKKRGLRGGALWHDGIMEGAERLIPELLKHACDQGATALNYVEVKGLETLDKRVTGVTALDRETGRFHRYGSKVVINAAGPWCRALARGMDRDRPSLFKGSVAWNIIFDRDALSETGLAVTPERPGGKTLFLLNKRGRLLGGTGHGPWNGGADHPVPDRDTVRGFIADINLAVPGLGLRESHIERIFPGLLPAGTRGGDLAVREVTVDHGAGGGPSGLYSVSGVKFTTARLVAEKLLKRIFPGATGKGGLPGGRFDGCGPIPGKEHRGLPGELMESLVDAEAVVHLDDLLFRRTSLWEDPALARRVGETVLRRRATRRVFGKGEMERVESLIKGDRYGMAAADVSEDP